MLSAYAVYNAETEHGSSNKNNTKKKKFNKLQKKALLKKTKKEILKSKGITKEVLQKKQLINNHSKLVSKRQIAHNEKEVKPLQTNGLKNKHEWNEQSDTDSVEPTLKKPKKSELKKLKKTKKLEKRQKGAIDIKNMDEDILKKPADLLNYLIAPIKTADFFNTYWEIKPLHISRNNGEYFKNLLSSQQIDAMLRDNLLYYTKNVDVVSYENDKRETHNPEGRAVPANIWDYYMHGCSVRILNPQTYNQKVRDLLSTLQEYFGTMVGVNVYLTPAGSQGFAPHYDDIEAFVIQLEGHKNWKLYAPRFDSEVLPRYSSKNLSRDQLKSPLKKLTLHAGDVLYFPRGFIHEASTDPDEHSLHITVSVYQNTAYADLLEKLLPEALKTASQNDVNFRKGLPLNYLKHTGIVNSEKRTPERREILTKVKELISKLVDYASVDMAADQIGRKFMYEALPPNISPSERQRSSKEDGDRLEYGVVKNIASFSPDTQVRLTRYYSQRLVIENNAAKVYYCTENANVYHGEEEQFLELDDTLIDTIKALQNNYPQYVSIEKLPCSDNDEVKKINALSDLWEKGLIVTREPLEIEDE